MVAASLVDAAAGLLAGAVANQTGVGHQAAAVFALCALACIGCHLVVLPGFVWASPIRLGELLRRTGLAGLALVLTTMAGLCFGMALASLPNPFGSGPGWTETAGLWSGRALLAATLAGAGALIGLGAAAAETNERRPNREGPPRARLKAHVWGGAMAVQPILLLAWAADAGALGPDLMVQQIWPLLPLLAATALVLAGWPNTVLLWRRHVDDQAPVPMLRRAAGLVVAGCGGAIGVMAATPAATPRPLHISPDGHYAVLLVSDTVFGQIEEVRVIAEPGTPAARVIFEQVGDQPLRFLRWTDVAIAELAFATRADGEPPDLTLICRNQACKAR